MDETMDRLIRALDLEKLEENLYRGVSSSVGWQRTFGGEVIAQALVAAQRTVGPERPSTRCTAISCAPATRRRR